MSNKMKVELLEIFGNDDMVATAARVSFGKEASNYSVDQNAKLIKYLAEHNHTSPFRHPQLQYRITCPIFVERQLFKHQVGLTANSISGRYVETTFIWTGSLLAYINFWKLRITRDTQFETMQIAMDMLCELKLRTNGFEHSLKAFHI